MTIRLRVTSPEGQNQEVVLINGQELHVEPTPSPTWPPPCWSARPSAGNWSLQLPALGPDGDYSVSTTASDEDLNISAPSPAFVIHHDATMKAPTIGGDTFTQAQLASGKIKYVHTGTGNDTLNLIVSDGYATPRQASLSRIRSVTTACWNQIC